MRSRWSFAYNLLIYFFSIVLVCGFQTTMWLQMFGSIAAPQLWLNIMVFIMLYKRNFHAIFLIYVLGFVLTVFTLAPLKLIYLTLLILFGLVYFVKKRIFWPGSGYFTIMCSLAGIAFHIIYLLLSVFLEKNPASLEFTGRMTQIILTPLFAPATYWILSKLTINVGEELSHQTGGLDL